MGSNVLTTHNHINDPEKMRKDDNKHEKEPKGGKLDLNYGKDEKFLQIIKYSALGLLSRKPRNSWSLNVLFHKIFSFFLCRSFKQEVKPMIVRFL